MTLWQAMAYFFTEASTGLLRTWRASAIAILTISLSLYVGALVLLLTGSLTAAADNWREQLRVSIYLENESTPGERARVLEEASRPAWVLQVDQIDSATATATFTESFPQMADLAASGALTLPESLSVQLLPGVAPEAQRRAWSALLRELPGVEMVDDDAAWLETLSAAVETIRSLGLILGLGLLVAAGFTIAGVVRLSAFLFVDEIDTLRLIGATEFFIRGPFYVSGFVQGLLGGVIAIVLFAATRWQIGLRAEGAFWEPLLIGTNLPWTTQLGLLATGAAAGLLGAILSLRRERLGSADGEFS